MATKPIKIAIVGDASKFEKTLGGIDSKLGKFTKGLGGVTTALAGAFAIGGIANLGMDLFNLGTELEVLENKSKTVFGGSLGGIQAWAEESAAKMGLTTRELIGLTTAAGDLLKPMGFNEQQAADLASEMNGLAGALSMNSQGKVDAAGASEILSKALLGERDGLQALGIKIDEEMLKERLLADGKSHLTGEALKQARATATLALITEQSTDAITAFEGADDSLLVKKNKLNAKFKELKETLAVALIPVFQTIASFLVDKGIPAFENIAAAVAGFWEQVKPVFQAVVESIQGFMDKFKEGEESTDETVTGIRKLVDQMKTTFEAAFRLIGTLIETARIIWAEYGDEITAVVARVFDFVVPALTNMFQIIEGLFNFFSSVLTGDWAGAWDAVEQIVDGVVGNIQNMMELVKDAVRGAINFVIDAWNGLEFTLPAVDLGPLGSLGGQTISTPNLPRLAEGTSNFQGGAVRLGERGPETAILPRGTEVLPAHMSGMEQTINVNVQTNADPHEIGREVAWAGLTSGR